MRSEIKKHIRRIAQGALIIAVANAALRADSIRMNAGGPVFTDNAGHVWAADNGFTGGGTYATAASIANTATPGLYQTEHYGNGATLEYVTAVANGQYSVTLKFAEIWYTSAGQRVFNIVINGSTVASNFDPFAAAGGANIAVDRTYVVMVTSGQIDIQLVPVTSNPKVSAIEIDAPGAPNFSDAETPGGSVNGTNAAFSLAHAPNPAASLLLIRNGLALSQGRDFSLAGSTITFAGGDIPQSGDTLAVWYRY